MQKKKTDIWLIHMTKWLSQNAKEEDRYLTNSHEKMIKSKYIRRRKIYD